MGAISEAIAKEARSRGVEITTGAEVISVRVKGKRAAGVALSDGTEIEARAVAAGVNPKLLYQRLVEPQALDPNSARERALEVRFGTFRMNVAFRSCPIFPAPPESTRSLTTSSGIIIAPSLGYMERAYFDARTRGYSREPIVEMLIPSTVVRVSRRRAKHVASLFCQHFNPTLPAPQAGREKEGPRQMRSSQQSTGTPRISRRASSPAESCRRSIWNAIRPDRRGHLSRGAHARPAVLGETRCSLRRLPLPRARTLSLAVPARIRADGVTERLAQRSARDPQRFPARLDAASRMLRRRSGDSPFDGAHILLRNVTA